EQSRQCEVVGVHELTADFQLALDTGPATALQRRLGIDKGHGHTYLLSSAFAVPTAGRIRGKTWRPPAARCYTGHTSAPDGCCTPGKLRLRRIFLLALEALHTEAPLSRLKPRTRRLMRR